MRDEVLRDPIYYHKKYAEQIDKRKHLFMEMSNVSRGAVVTFVTPKGIKQGVNSSFVHSSVTADDLFATLGKM